MFNKSVDQIVGVFTKAIADLETLEDNRNTSINNAYGIVEQAQKQINTHKSEIARSKAIRENLLKITAGM